MTRPTCKLIGEDGNVFSIIGLVSRTLKRAGMKSEAEEFLSKVDQQKDYDAVLRLCMAYVDIE